MLALMVVGSIADILYNRSSTEQSEVKQDEKSAMYHILVSFSLPRNFKKLIKDETADERFRSIHGVKFLSLTYVFLGHVYVWVNINYLIKVSRAKEWYNDYSFEIIHNAWVSVDSFFVMSGLLTSYILLHVMEKKRVNILIVIGQRYLRLFPVLVFAVGFVFFLPWISDGPFWENVAGSDLKACYKSWWWNLLFINNFLPIREICIHYSWYVQCDLQLFIVGIVILLLLKRSPVIGLTTMFLAIVGSIVSVGMLTYIYEFPPTSLLSIPNEDLLNQVLSVIHIRPYTHLGPYCVGMLVGCALKKYRHAKIKPVVQILFWLLATVLCWSALLGAHEWNTGYFPPLMATAAYAALHRTAWAIGVAWLLFACVTGRGGLINSFLSIRPFVILSRLSYCAYLLQGFVMWTRFGRVKNLTTMTHYDAVCEFISNTVLILVCATACYLLIERPFSNLVRLMLYTLGTRVEKNIRTKPDDSKGEGQNGFHFNGVGSHKIESVSSTLDSPVFVEGESSKEVVLTNFNGKDFTMKRDVNSN